MYDELVKRVRQVAEEVCDDYDVDPYIAEQRFFVIEEAANAIEELVGKTDRFRWIPVTERLPEEDESVLVVRKFIGLKGQVPPSTYVEIAYRIGDGWVADSDEYKIARNRHTDPLYWMPLPEPPKEE